QSRREGTRPPPQAGPGLASRRPGRLARPAGEGARPGPPGHRQADAALAERPGLRRGPRLASPGQPSRGGTPGVAEAVGRRRRYTGARHGKGRPADGTGHEVTHSPNFRHRTVTLSGRLTVFLVWTVKRLPLSPKSTHSGDHPPRRVWTVLILPVPPRS